MKIRIDVEKQTVRGPLTLFPLFSAEPEAAPYLPGPEAAERQLFGVSEVGSEGVVPELEIENRADLPLLLIEGEMLVGAKQNRTLNVSIICAPKSRLVIPVSCVEAGRWGSTRRAAHSRFHAGVSLRERKSRSVHESLKAKRGRRSDQGAVWDSVERASVRLKADSSTSSYDEVLDCSASRFPELIYGLAPADGQRGVLIGIGGRPRALDLFDRPATLSAYWPSLIAGYASDALGEAETPTRPEAAQAFLDQVLAAPLEQTDAVGLGKESHSGSMTITTTALHWGTATVHLAAFAAA